MPKRNVVSVATYAALRKFARHVPTNAQDAEEFPAWAFIRLSMGDEGDTTDQLWAEYLREIGHENEVASGLESGYLGETGPCRGGLKNST